MKAILQMPCCGEMVEVEHADPDVLAKKLTIEVNKHYEHDVFKCASMDDWWLVSSALGIGIVLEDGETVEDEYARVTKGMSLQERASLLAIFGYMIGMDTVMLADKTPVYPVPEVDIIEMLAFHGGLAKGSNDALKAGLEGAYAASEKRDYRSLLVGIEETEREPMLGMDLRDKFDDVKSVPPGIRVH